MLGETSKVNFKIVLLLIALILYANSFSGEFIWDDYPLILNNPLIQSWSNLPKIFTSDLYHSTGGRTNFYRPLVSVSFMWDYFLWGKFTFGYHLTNVVLHLLNAILFFLIISRLTHNKLISFYSSALFLVHPLAVSVVSYISGRADSLALLFILSCFLSYLKGSRAHYALSIIFFILALLSKEIAMIFPLLLLLYLLYFKERSKLSSLLPFLAVTLTYLLLRLTVLDFSYRPLFLSKYSPFERLITTPKIILSYLNTLIFPFNLHMERTLNVSKSLIEPVTLLSLLTLVLIIFSIFYLKRRHKLISFGLAWFIVALLPLLGLVPLNATIADHWLYVPSLGFFLSLTVILKRRQNVALIIICLIFSLITINRNTDWKDEFTFFTRTLAKNPASALAHNNLGALYARQNNYDLAKKEYIIAIEVDPEYTEAINNLGLAYKRENKIDEAIKQFQLTLALEPNRVMTRNSLGVAYGLNNEEQKAEEEFKKTIELNPYFAEAYYNLGALYYRQKKYNQALVMWREVLKLEPQSIFIRDWLVNTERLTDAQLD